MGKAKHKRIFLIIVVIILVLVVTTLPFVVPYVVNVGHDWTKIHFDVKLLRLNTNINVYKNNEQIGSVKGNILRIITDPLTFYDVSGNIIAFADDTYHFIAQDSHTIISDGVVTAEMVGKFKLLGEAYDIYNHSGEKIAHAEFDYLNLFGKITDNKGNAIVGYKSNPILKDFDIYVSPNSEIDDTTLIMIFSSYFSDKTADDQASSNKNTN